MQLPTSRKVLTCPACGGDIIERMESPTELSIEVIVEHDAPVASECRALLEALAAEREQLLRRLVGSALPEGGGIVSGTPQGRRQRSIT